ncbi:hypothetical protein [Gordonia sp. NPDC003585]|uniref:hypothetical protein n=1 Tax=Gordonia sp. NPDC003585 TaxID=3154275 RepID=UPI0033BF271A
MKLVLMVGDSLTAALTASGVVYELGDFSDPHLDGPTALQVDDDGNVRGHLACWDTPHIGYADVVTPPRTASGYQFFHQGVVRTAAGDLPVGKLTIGTGHAGPNGDHLAAAAHYDNTGSTVAVVRAGEDAHGIWLAGKIVPGTADVRIDELRRSSVSGDWRDIRHNGQFELVAALACNVPGFPIPRTEALAVVSSGEAHDSLRSTRSRRGRVCECGCGQAVEESVEESAVASFAAARQRAQYAVGTRPGSHIILASGWETPAAYIVATADPWLTAGASYPYGWRRVVRVDKRTGATRIATYRQLEDQIVAATPIQARPATEAVRPTVVVRGDDHSRISER